MVGSWCLTHATKKVVWSFTLPLFCFCFVEENARMSKHENKWYAILQTKKFVECICMMMPWLMQNVRLEYDNGQMQERYVHYDVMKKCLCDAWYECIYGHESPKNYLFLLAHLGAQCPTCTVKKVIWTFRLPVTKYETNIQRVRDDMMQMGKSASGGCTQHGNILK